MDFEQLIKQLSPYIQRVSNIDNIEQWKDCVSELPPKHKKYVFEFAGPKWIQRMLESNKLLIHPDVKEELKRRNYKPLKRHKQLIYASLLASYNNPDSQDYFYRLKAKIEKKHNTHWWKGVFDRIKPTYAVRKRLEEVSRATGPALKAFASQSVFMGNALIEERESIMERLPKE